jgi:hypothetical protein
VLVLKKMMRSVWILTVAAGLALVPAGAVFGKANPFRGAYEGTYSPNTSDNAVDVQTEGRTIYLHVTSAGVAVGVASSADKEPLAAAAGEVDMDGRLTMTAASIDMKFEGQFFKDGTFSGTYKTPRESGTFGGVEVESDDIAYYGGRYAGEFRGGDWGDWHALIDDEGICRADVTSEKAGQFKSLGLVDNNGVIRVGVVESGASFHGGISQQYYVEGTWTNGDLGGTFWGVQVDEGDLDADGGLKNESQTDAWGCFIQTAGGRLMD